MTDIVLGQPASILDKRDAIHIAIAPIIAGENLKPGEHVGVGNNGYAYKSAPKIGIVDPFLTTPIEQYQHFYLLLYQNSVTGMRHHWQHPVFTEEKVLYTKEESEQWLRNYIDNADCPSYNDVIAAATGGQLTNTNPEYYDEAYYNDGDYLHFNGRDAHGDIPDEFWDHIENVTGVKVPQNQRASQWSCSC